MSKKVILIYSFILIIAGICVAVYIDLNFSNQVTANAPLELKEAAISAITQKNADLGFQKYGKIVFVAKKIGESVSAGEILAKIDETDALAQYSQAKSSVSIARADLAALENSLSKEKLRLKTKDLSSNDKKIQKKQIDAVENNILSQKARVNQATDNLTSAKNQLDQCVMKAPFDGLITRVDIELGEIVNPNISVITLTEK